MQDSGSCHVRHYGDIGPRVVVLHGGPGAPGCMAPVARGLADSFRVLEPFQRPSGNERLSVARHVRDLDELVTSLGPDARPALVGSSWGAMLALAYGARHHERIGALALVGCGTFDAASREVFQETITERTDSELAYQLATLQGEFDEPDERLRAYAERLLPVYSHDLWTDDQELASCDAQANAETWSDMMRLQEQGVYPAAFSAIRCPVIMLHGAVDPHPGEMIRASLAPHLPQLEYLEWERCGHYPWMERATRDTFFDVLREWLQRCAQPTRAD